jgi:hypothetical protein
VCLLHDLSPNVTKINIQKLQISDDCWRGTHVSRSLATQNIYQARVYRIGDDQGARACRRQDRDFENRRVLYGVSK